MFRFWQFRPVNAKPLFPGYGAWDRQLLWHYFTATHLINTTKTDLRLFRVYNHNKIKGYGCVWLVSATKRLSQYKLCTHKWSPTVTLTGTISLWNHKYHHPKRFISVMWIKDHLHSHRTIIIKYKIIYNHTNMQ